MVSNVGLVAARALWADASLIEVSLASVLKVFLENHLGSRDPRLGRKCRHGPQNRSDLSHILEMWIHYF
jgi:hypothetical protein